MEEIHISPFIATVLSSMATYMNGQVDLKRAEIRTECGEMRISLSSEDTVYIEGLYIDLDKQGEGCGSAMLKALETIVSKISMRTMYIRLWPVKGAIGFYFKNNYELYVEMPPEAEYILAKKKLYGRGWKQYEAKTRLKLDEQAGESNRWTHDMMYPLFQESGLDNGNPKFYSFYVADVANGDYQYMVKTIQPTRGTQMSMIV